MATRFWVGGAGNWNSTSTAHWSATSGGAGGASVPGLGDNVQFDVNSGVNPGFSVNFVGTTLRCANLTITAGFFGVFAAQAGSILQVWGSAITLNGATLPTHLTVTVITDCTITSSSGTFGGPISGNSGTLVLADNLICSSALSLTGGVLFNAANHNLTASSFAASSGVDVVTMGSGTWTLTGTGAVWTAVAGTTITAGTSTIAVTDASGASKQFSGGSFTYRNLTLSGSGVGSYQISGSNTFNALTVSTPPDTVNFDAGTTTTVTSLVASGTAGNIVTLQSGTPGTRWNLVCASGQITLGYAAIKDSAASGGATFLANASVNNGNNSGWRFNANEQMMLLF